MSSYASFRLVLHTAHVATSALKSLNDARPLEHLVVDEAMSSITRALRAVTHALTVPEAVEASKVERPSGIRLRTVQPTEETQEEELDEYDLRRPVHPALIDQEIRGTKTLLLEVVRRAAYDWVLYRTSTRLIQKKLAEDAYVWLFEEGPGHPHWEERAREGKSITAFITICSELDLEAATVRSYVRRLTVKNVMSVGRPAEYRRRDTASLRENQKQLADGSDPTGTDDF